MVKVAVVQTNPRLADKEHNLRQIEQDVAQVAKQDVKLAVFPECAITGYVYESLEEAMQVAERVPGPISDRVAGLAQRHGLYLVAGMLERAGDACYNTALLADPDGSIQVYRKTHTLCLGVDRFTRLGNTPFIVYTLPFARIGLLICYDLRFPEPARVLALRGAQIIVLPTNWPRSSTVQPDVFTRARAAENRVFVLAADRVGTERGAHFLGRSQIVGPDGTVIEEASDVETAIIVRDIDPAEADTKNVVVRKGEHEMDAFADRRPDLYGRIAAAHPDPEAR